MFQQRDINAQSIYVEGAVTALRMDGSNSDCSGNPDPRIFAQVSTSSAGWSGTWSFQTDDRGSGTVGSCGMTCYSGSCGSCGFGNAATFTTTQAVNQNWQVQLYGYEDDGGCPFDSNDGDCGGYSIVRNTDILSTWAPNCGGGYNTGQDSRACRSDGETYNYYVDWQFRYYFTGLSNANAGGTISLSNSDNSSICAGGSISQINGTSLLSNRFSNRQWQYSYNGGAYADISGATGQNYTPAAGLFNSAGTYNFRRRLSYCINFSNGTSAYYSNIICVVAFPADVIIPDATNRCFNVTVPLPTVATVTAFNIQWSIDGGAFAAPAVPTTVGCHTLQTRYALSNTCDATAAGSGGPASACDGSNISNVVIFPTAPTITAPATVCFGTSVTLPTVTSYAANGFTTQWSINGGTYTASPTLPTTTGCHTVKVRYILTSACGGTAANAIGPAAGCVESNTVNFLIVPQEPTITDATSVCFGTSVTLPTVSSVASFQIRWSIDGGTYTASPTLPTTIGCHTFQAKYVTVPTCGSIPGFTEGPYGCIESNISYGVIFPTKPTLLVPSNVCEGTAFTLPSVTTVAGFTTQYSINGLTYTSSPTIPTTPGCHTIKARYILIDACGNTLASATAPAGCLESNTVSVVTFPTAPIIVSPSNTCQGIPFTLPTVAAVSGFTVQYSINSGAFSASPTIPTASATYSVEARYVLTSACGTTVANTAGSGACGKSNSVNVTIDPTPTATPNSQVFTCDNTASLNATSVTSGATVSWQYVSGPVNPTGTTTSNPLLITFSSAGTGIYNLLVSKGACININVGNISSVMPTTSTSTIANTASCGYCVVTDGNTRTFYNSNGQIIGKIDDDPLVTPAQLNLTEMCTRINNSVQTVSDNLGNNQPYLQRQWTVSPTNNTKAKVTLYFTSAELSALQVAALSTVYQFSGFDLWVTKYPGGSGGLFTAPATLNGVYVPATFSSFGSNYKVEMDVSTYSTFYIHPALFPFAALPVELTSFTGWNQGAVNHLQWITASEENTLKYQIQKSTTSGNWEAIGEKAAAGNSNQQLNYDFADSNPVIGNNYYRLKMIDIDGKFTFSNTINIPINEAVLNGFTRVYPNPTDGKLNVELQATSSFETKLTVYDVVGKKAFEKTTLINKGLNTVGLDFSTLAKGAYVLQFADGTGKIYTTKFIKE